MVVCFVGICFRTCVAGHVIKLFVSPSLPPGLFLRQGFVEHISDKCRKFLLAEEGASTRPLWAALPQEMEVVARGVFR